MLCYVIPFLPFPGLATWSSEEKRIFPAALSMVEKKTRTGVYVCTEDAYWSDVSAETNGVWTLWMIVCSWNKWLEKKSFNSLIFFRNGC